jgi:type IV pilus assembly protein PilX
MRTSRPTRQRGTALVVGLLLLLVLTVLGMSASNTSVMQERMAGAMRDRDMAFQAAESALRDAERRLAQAVFVCGYQDLLPASGGSITATLPDGQTFTIWAADAAGRPDPWNDASWPAADAYAHALTGVNAAPRFTVEAVLADDNTRSIVFRITARGTAGARGARSVLEAHYRRSFERILHIIGDGATNVVALGDGVLAAQASGGVPPDVQLSLGGWVPGACVGGDDDFTVYYQGTGGADTLIIGDLVGLGYAPGMNQMLDLTAQVVGLPAALSDYRIRRVLVDNEGSSAVAISTLGISDRFTEDNHYCINSATGDAGQPVLEKLTVQLLDGLVAGSALVPILSYLNEHGDGLLGPAGLLPLLPLSASMVLDGTGNDLYEVYTDTSAATIVLADVAGSDHYRLRATGDGFLNLPVIIDVDGDATYDVEGGSYTGISLDGGAHSTLQTLLNSAQTPDLLDNLAGAFDFLDGSIDCSGLIGSLLCNTLSPLAAHLSDILAAVSGLFDEDFTAAPDQPVAHTPGLCTPVVGERLNWREVLP